MDTLSDQHDRSKDVEIIHLLRVNAALTHSDRHAVHAQADAFSRD